MIFIKDIKGVEYYEFPITKIGVCLFAGFHNCFNRRRYKEDSFIDYPEVDKGIYAGMV